MPNNAVTPEEREQRRKRRALRKARNHLADPQSKLGRLLAAYAKQKQDDPGAVSLPEV